MRAVPPAEGLGRSGRLLRPAQFQAVYRGGRKAAGRLLVLWALPSDSGGIRLGVVAGRKVGNAVRRNRARRLLREAFRRERAGLRGPADVVVVARRPLADASFEEAKADFLAAVRRAGLSAGGAAGGTT